MRLWPQSSQRSTWPPSAAERQLLDRRHHLELAEAHMPGIGLAPSGAMARKDVRDLQPRAAHAPPATPRVAASRRVSGASRSSGLVTVADRGVGDAGVKRRGVELGVAEQHLDHADIDVSARAGGWRSCAAACAATRAS